MQGRMVKEHPERRLQDLDRTRLPNDPSLCDLQQCVKHVEQLSKRSTPNPCVVLLSVATISKKASLSLHNLTI